MTLSLRDHWSCRSSKNNKILGRHRQTVWLQGQKVCINKVELLVEIICKLYLDYSKFCRHENILRWNFQVEWDHCLNPDPFVLHSRWQIFSESHHCSKQSAIVLQASSNWEIFYISLATINCSPVTILTRVQY